MSENRRAMDKEFVQMIKDISAIKAHTENTKELMHEHVKNFKNHVQDDVDYHNEIDHQLSDIKETQSRVKYMIVGAVSVVTCVGYALKWGAGFLIK